MVFICARTATGFGVHKHFHSARTSHGLVHAHGFHCTRTATSFGVIKQCHSVRASHGLGHTHGFSMRTHSHRLWREHAFPFGAHKPQACARTWFSLHTHSYELRGDQAVPFGAHKPQAWARTWFTLCTHSPRLWRAQRWPFGARSRRLGTHMAARSARTATGFGAHKTQHTRTGPGPAREASLTSSRHGLRSYPAASQLPGQYVF